MRSHVTSKGTESMKEICTQETAVFSYSCHNLWRKHNLISYLLAVCAFKCLFKVAYLQKDFIQSEQLSGFQRIFPAIFGCFYIA